MEGLEKIASDLRVERTKATNALRDRARLKVENESTAPGIKRKRRSFEYFGRVYG